MPIASTHIARFRFYFLFAVYCISGNTAGLAQTATYDFDMRRISLKDGLVNQSITAICTGRKGQLWIGTLNGLYSYDGFRVSRYDVPGAELQHLPDHQITDLQDVKESGIILVCTRNGTCAIDPVLRKNVPERDLGIPEGLLKNCLQIEKSASGFYFAYTPGMMYRLEASGPRLLKMAAWYQVNAGKDLKMAADPGRGDAVWLLPKDSAALYLTSQSLHRYTLEQVHNNVPEIKGLVYLIYAGAKTLGWDIAWNLYEFDPKRGEWLLSKGDLYDYFPALKPIETLQSHRIMLNATVMLEAGQEGLCTNSGLFIIRKKTAAFHSVAALRNKEIRGIYTDSSGTWWASTYNGTFSGAPGRSGAKYFPALKGVWSFLPSSPDSCLLAFEMENGIGKWDFKSAQVRKNKIIGAPSSGSGGYHALSLCRDFRGVVWAGTYEELLHNSPANPASFEVFVDPLSGRKFEEPVIRSILADRDSSIWIGTENGLFHLLFNKIWNRYEQDPESPYARGIVVSGLYQDRFGNLWLATKGNGIACRYSRGHWRWITTANGLSNDVTCRVEGSDQDRVLWISTHHGLSRFDIVSGTFCNYFEENGLPFDEFNAGSSAHVKNGILYFGGLNGMVYFCPDSVPVYSYKFRTIISSVKVYNSRYDTLQTFFPGHEGLSLWPYPEYVEILLGANEFIQRDKIRFRYRLIGISDNWTFTNGEREIKYFQLPPGQYVLEVQIWLPGGYFGETEKLTLTVRAPFYETPWFILLLFLASLLFAHRVYLWRVRRVLKEQEIRRQIADDLHDDIGNKLNIISILAQKIARLQQPAGQEPYNTALQKLVGVTRDALLSLHTMIWTVDPNKDKLLDMLVRMEDFADDYLHPLNISYFFRFPEMIPGREINLKMRHHLILIYQELLTNMIKHSPPKQVVFQITLSESGRFELEMLNEHIEKTNEYATISGHRGMESLKRRLQQVDGVIEQKEMAENLQRTALIVFNIFKK